MNLGNCNSGSNNIYINSPPLMSDGRNFASWQPGTEIDNTLKNLANINSNSKYREYLIKNADQIIKFNQSEACNNCGCCPYYSKEQASSNSPYIYDSCLSKVKPFGYEESDLKNLYLSREQLEKIHSEPIMFKLN